MKSAHTRSLILVFAAGVLWSTVGLGIRLIQEADVWQILLYRSMSLTIFLYIVIRIHSSNTPFVQVRRTGLPGVIAALSLVVAYAGGIYAIQTTSVANAMLLFASAPFLAAVLGWGILRERVHGGTWIAIFFAIVGIGIMVGNQTFGGSLSTRVRSRLCRFYRYASLGKGKRDAALCLPVGYFRCCDYSRDLHWFGAAIRDLSTGLRYLYRNGYISGRSRLSALYAGLESTSCRRTDPDVTGRGAFGTALGLVTPGRDSDIQYIGWRLRLAWGRCWKRNIQRSGQINRCCVRVRGGRPVRS